MTHVSVLAYSSAEDTTRFFVFWMLVEDKDKEAAIEALEEEARSQGFSSLRSSAIEHKDYTIYASGMDVAPAKVPANVTH